MKLSYPSAKEFSKSLEAVWNLVDEGTFKIKKEGISLLAIDPSQISMVVFNLKKDEFMEYEIEEESKISLDIDYLKNIMKRAKEKETLTLEKDEGYLNIKFKSTKYFRNFKIPLLDLSEGINREPKIEYHNSLKISSDVLKEMIKDASLVSSYIRFVVTPDSFEVSASSERGEVNEVIEKDSEEVLELNVEDGARAYYPIQYLEDILKASPRGEYVKLSFETDIPLKVEYVVGKAEVKYYLAPRKEEE